MITSPHNEKLKLIRRLGRRRSREREGLFVTEGEDLLAAARDAGAEPGELITGAGAGLCAPPPASLRPSGWSCSPPPARDSAQPRWSRPCLPASRSWAPGRGRSV